jgi:NAD(P)-dependent dehydrogenase (short-subunit alcohol dehydrogenase family)
VGIIARDAKTLEQLKDELTGLGTVSATEAVDVADAAAMFAAAERLEARLGKIDLWINDAMETVFSTVADLSPEEFRRVTEVTYLGFVYGTMAALKSMRPRRRGRILQIGSALAYRGIPLQAAYCGAKHAIRGFTDSLRAELLHEGSGIRISIVELPAVNTPQFDWARVHLPRTPRPMGRPIEPEVVADAVFRAAHGSWREYWLGLPTILTIMANMIVPGFLDRYLARHAFEGQQTRVTVGPDRRDNLERPVSGLHVRAAHLNPKRYHGLRSCRASPSGSPRLQRGHWLSRPWEQLLSWDFTGRSSKAATARPLTEAPLELPSRRKGPDPVCRATGDRLDGERGIDAAYGGEDRTVADPGQQ